MPNQKRDGRWKCPDCDEEFPSMEMMQRHGVEEHGWEESDVEGVPATQGRRGTSLGGFEETR